MKIVVTGGASGLGEALVRRLVAHKVWILDRNEPANLAEGHHYIAVDLSDPASIQEAVSALPAELDGLANVAAIADAPDTSLVLAVNFLGLREMTEGLIPRLGAGRIVNISSIAGRDWQKRYEKLVPLLETSGFEEGLAWVREHLDGMTRDPYALSKRVVTAYTLRMAQGGVSQGYRINSVSPGPIETPLYPEFESLMGKDHSDWTREQTGRRAEPNDIAEVVDLLLTGECSWLNGVDIPVDGGYSAGIESGWIDFSQSPVMQRLRS